MDAAPRIAFYANDYSSRTASIRLRCLAIIKGLRELGLTAEPYSASNADDYDIVVFSKTYDNKALATGTALKAAGKRVVLDLCDNHFFGEAQSPQIAERAARLGEMLNRADHLTVSTATLGAQVRERYAVAPDAMSVIPDPIEPVSIAKATLADRFALFGLERFLDRGGDALRLVWFGNHGAGHAASGMTDLLSIAPIVNACAKVHPMVLTVISNNRGKFAEIAEAFEIKTRYMTWSQGRIAKALAMQDVAVIPISNNPFTVAKSINRPATALLAGLGVVADSIPSYEELRPFVHLDDWAEGLRDYASRKSRIGATLEPARVHLSETYAVERVSRCWRDVLLKL